MLLGEDVGKFGGAMAAAQGVHKKFGDRRVIDTPISESAIIGAEISARVMEEGFDLLEGPVRRVASLDTPIPFSPVLEKAVIPNAEKIAAAVREMFANA